MPDLRDRIRTVAVAWIAVWPTVTALLMIVEPFTTDWPLPLQTLLVTAIMVPAMVLLLVPTFDRLASAAGRRLNRNDQQTTQSA